MHRIVTTAAAICALLAAAPVRAQEAAPDTTPRTSLQKGAWSLSFDVPAYGGNIGSGAFGGWKMIGERTNLGLIVGLQVSSRDESPDGSTREHRSSSLILGLHARRYTQTIRDVTPFVTAGIDGLIGRGTHRDGSTSVKSLGYGANAEAGVGVEWFPVRRVSLAGHTGAKFGLYGSENEYRSDTDTREQTHSAVEFGTFTSQLSIQFYF